MKDVYKKRKRNGPYVCTYCNTTSAGRTTTIGKDSLTCITFDKPLVNRWGGFKAAQEIWLRNIGVGVKKNCGLDGDCGSFGDGARIVVPYFKENDFFELSASVWIKRLTSDGCWPVMTTGNCSTNTIQV